MNNDPAFDLGQLSLTEIIRLQSQLQQQLTQRFERRLVLMFSDIVGSTPYFAAFGDAAGRQLQQLHADLLSQALLAHGGRLVDTAGDGAFCVLPDADKALSMLQAFHDAIAMANHTRSRPHLLVTRTGLHTGAVLTDGQIVSGDAVNVCARVSASAQPGEVRLTQALFQALPLHHRLACRPLGAMDLKGVPQPVSLLSVDRRDHRTFPRRMKVLETGEELSLPQQDIVSFGRLAERDGQLGNDVVLAHPDPQRTRLISRWHFELRRLPQRLELRPLSENSTVVDGQPVGVGQAVPVRDGSTVELGGALVLRLYAGDPLPAEAPVDDSTMLAFSPPRTPPA